MPRNVVEMAPMHIHILGICGTFMGGIALIARQAGHRVTGCDANVYPPMSTQLEAQGIELIEGFDINRFGSAPTKFDVQDLFPLTGRYLQSLPWLPFPWSLR